MGFMIKSKKIPASSFVLSYSPETAENLGHFKASELEEELQKYFIIHRVDELKYGEKAQLAGNKEAEKKERREVMLSCRPRLRI